jgi:hypothetical protein
MADLCAFMQRQEVVGTYCNSEKHTASLGQAAAQCLIERVLGRRKLARDAESFRCVLYTKFFLCMKLFITLPTHITVSTHCWPCRISLESYRLTPSAIDHTLWTLASRTQLVGTLLANHVVVGSHAVVCIPASSVKRASYHSAKTRAN